jgi:trehalose 6-phosphate synthase
MAKNPALDNKTELQILSEQILAQRTLILCSNRGPVEFSMLENGEWDAVRGAGGLVTAMSAASKFATPTWIAAAMGEGDRARAAAAGDARIDYETPDANYHLRFVVPPADDYHQYYNVIANPLLWFLQHSMWDAPRTPSITPEIWEAWGAYERVNQLFADAIIQEVERSPSPAIIMLQDYHLYLVAERLRGKIGKDSMVTLFIHIPWPGSDYLALLPAAMRESILRSCCALDIIGFQTRRFLRNFLNSCRAFLPGAIVDYEKDSVTVDGQTVYAHVYPISIDVDTLEAQAETSPTIRDHRYRLRGHAGDQTIVRVDRIEPSKNIVRGFQAFELLLQKHPEHRGRVKFLSFLVPSRLGVEEYGRYLEEIMVTVGWINMRYGDGEWQPVELFVGEDYERAIAAMQLYDVLLVNPISDGMNLVAKEGPTVNSVGGVLILSEGAGAVEQLQEAALVVSPTDIVGTAEALDQALNMPLGERYQRTNELKHLVAEEDITKWLWHQFDDIRALLTTDVKKPRSKRSSPDSSQVA